MPEAFSLPPALPPEIPLEGLCTKPLHLATEEELRAHVARLQELRSNAAALYAQIRGQSKTRETASDRLAKDEASTANLFGDF